MSTHINAPIGAIADAVLLPGDPLRAKFIAENFLEDAKCYNEVRGMYGFTGTYKGKKVSVQGTGMGQPSLSIYVQELFQFYDVQKAVRIGTAGAVSELFLVEVLFLQMELLQILVYKQIALALIIMPRFHPLNYFTLLIIRQRN